MGDTWVDGGHTVYDDVNVSIIVDGENIRHLDIKFKEYIITKSYKDLLEFAFVVPVTKKGMWFRRERHEK